MFGWRYSILMILLISLALASGCDVVEGEKGDVSTSSSTVSVTDDSAIIDPKDKSSRNRTEELNQASPSFNQSEEQDRIESDKAESDKTAFVRTKSGSEVIRTIEDWRALGLNRPVRTLVCSGAGALRLVTFLGCSDRVIAVEQLEKRSGILASYRVAHPEYAELPVFGEGHGRDNIEVLLKLTPKPDLIVRIDNPGAGIDPEMLQAKTGIPVLLLPYGNLGEKRAAFDSTIQLLGEVLGKSERANDLLTFIDSQINELRERSTGFSAKTSTEQSKRDGSEKGASVYLGGLSYRGSHGFNSTTNSYPPLDWLNLKNVTTSLSSTLIRSEHVMVAREQILVWDPDYIFLDWGTIAMGDSNGWSEVSQGAMYRSLKTVKTKKIYSLYPNNFYSANYDAILANAWFIGATIYPDKFTDIDPKIKAEEIFKFMVGGEVMNRLPENVRNSLFTNLFENKK